MKTLRDQRSFCSNGPPHGCIDDDGQRCGTGRGGARLPARGLPLDDPVAKARRQGDPAQEPEPDLLPDQRRRSRGDPRRGRHARCGPGYDWFFPYYRDRALCLALGVTPYEMLLQAVGAKDDPASGGRQMPSHWGHKRLNIVSQGSPTGTQCLHAVGCAEAGRFYQRLADIPGRESRHHPDEVVYVSLGDGTTSEGEFWESLNTACVKRLPVVYLDRGQRLRHLGAGGSRDAGRRHLAARRVVPRTCTSSRSTAPTSRRAPQRAAATPSPTRASGAGRRSCTRRSIRPYSHSLSDDERLYKTPAEREAEAAATRSR